MKSIRNLLLILFPLLINQSCSENNLKKDLKLNLSDTKQTITTYVMDWQNSDYLPSNPSNVISFPWKGVIGSNSTEMLYDYKSSDGWTLVYNTFSPSVSPYFQTMPPGGLYFALYNIYRGLLRFYLYSPPGWITPTSNIQHGLNLSPIGNANSSMLNFEGVDLVNLSNNQTSISKTNNQQMQAYGNWILMQYEIAYDPNIGSPGDQYPNLALNWWSKAFTITDAQLSGSEVGTITGNITQPSSGFNVGSTLASLGTAALEIYGGAELTPLISAAGSAASQKNYLSALQSGLNGALGNSISGFFNGIVGGNSSNSQSVNLVFNAQISLSGTLQNSTGLTSPTLVIPGQANAQSNSDQWIPFNKPMGVFNISAKPKIKDALSVITYSNRQPSQDIVSDAYSIVGSSYNLIYNANVTANATISNIRQQILAIDPPSTSLYLPGSSNEQVGNSFVYSNVSTWPSHTRGSGGLIGTKFAIRIALDVTPFNGAPKSTIVKTFLADVTH